MIKAVIVFKRPLVSPLSTLRERPTVLLLRAQGLPFCPPHSRTTQKVPAGFSMRIKCGNGKIKRVLDELKEKRWIGSSNTRLAVTVTKWDSQWQVTAGVAMLRELPRLSGRNPASWDPLEAPSRPLADRLFGTHDSARTDWDRLSSRSVFGTGDLRTRFCFTDVGWQLTNQHRKPVCTGNATHAGWHS